MIETIILTLLAFVAVTFIVLTFLPTSRAARMSAYRARLAFYERLPAGTAGAAQPTSILRQRDFSRIGVVQSMLSAGTYADRVALSLLEAAVPLRVGEYLAIRLAVAIIFMAPVPIVGMPVFLAAPLGFLGYMAPRFYVSQRQSQRLQKFNDSLVDALTMMSNALKSGSSFLQSLDLVSRELAPPLSEEFARVVAEVSIGTPVEEALLNLSRRVKSYDLYLTVTAMLVQRETGGNLAEVLENISYTIRERVRLLRQVQVLTAQERMGSYVVGALPVGALIGFSVLSPGYTDIFFKSTVGYAMLGATVALQVIGFMIMKAVAKIDV